MNILISSSTIDGVDLNSSDEIGIFDIEGTENEICVGVGFVSGAITLEIPLSIIASINDPSTTDIDGFTSGNAIIYKAWSSDFQTEYSTYQATYNPAFDSYFNSLGTALVDLTFLSYITQTIELDLGWNIMSFYVITNTINLLDILDPLVASNELTKVIDEAGGFIQYITGYGWMNTIGSLNPCEGYYIKVSTNDTLILSEPSKTYTSTQSPEIPKPVYFLSNNLNPYNPMNFVITKIVGEGSEVENDDEIAVYDSNIKVCSTVITQSYNGLQVITNGADDPLIEDIDGFIEGNNISFKYWDKSNNTEYNNIKVFHSYGEKEFTGLGTFVGELKIFTTGLQEIEISEATYLGQNYPNLFSNKTTIEYGIANEEKVLLSIYDIFGRRIKILANEFRKQGKHIIIFDRSILKSGLYYYKFVKYLI